MSYRLWVFSFMLVVFGLLNVQVWAQERSSDFFTLGEVVVQGKRPGVESVGTTRVVTAEELHERGVRTLDEAIELVPGLHVRTATEGSPRIDIRGFRTRHVLFLLNGIPINSTFDGQFDPSTFSIENIAEIKVTTGGSSVLYGEGNNGGVINVITKKGEAGLQGRVNGEIGRGNARLGRFSFSGGNHRVDAFVSGSYYDRDNYRLSDDFNPTRDEDGAARENSDRTRNNLFANLGFFPTEFTEVGLTLNYIKGENGKPPVANYDKNDPFAKKPKYERIDDLEGFSVQTALSHDFAGPFSLRGWVYFNQLDSEENRYDGDDYDTQLEKGAFRNNTLTENAGLNLQLMYELGKLGNVTLALMFDNNDWDADGFSMEQSSKDDPVIREKIAQQRDVQVYSGSLQYEGYLLEDLGVTAGIGMHQQKRDDGSEEDDYSYVIGGFYDLFEKTRVRISHARKIRFPSIRQLYEIGSGSPDLEAERSLHYEVGIEQRFPAATSVSLVGFVTDAKEFIEKDTADRFHNFEEYRFKGFELVAENRWFEDLLLRASYSYLDTEDRSDGQQKNELQYRPRDKFSIESRYAFPSGLTAYASLLYVANQYFYAGGGESPLLREELPSYTLVDVKASQVLIEDSLEIYFGVRNLFDKNYEQSYGLPQAGRYIYAGMDCRF